MTDATKHHIEDGVEGPQRIMVPISESRVNRAVFNAVADEKYDRDLRTREEIIDVWEEMTEELSDTIDDGLAQIGPVETDSDSDIERVYSAVSEAIADE